MPIALRPGGTWWYTLQGDRELPDPRPQFELLHLTGHQQIDLAEELDGLSLAGDGGEAVRKAFEKLGDLLIAWRDVVDVQGKQVAFAGTRADDLLTYSEALELCYAAFGGSMTEDDRKNSESRPVSGPVAGAGEPDAEG